MDFLWMICIFLLAANRNCGCCESDSCGISSAGSCGTGIGSCRGTGTGNCCGTGADTGCSCVGSAGRSFRAGSDADCGCCTADSDIVPDDCSCEVPQPLMPGPSGDFRTAQYPFPPYPVLRE